MPNLAKPNLCLIMPKLHIKISLHSRVDTLANLLFIILQKGWKGGQGAISLTWQLSKPKYVEVT